MAEKWAVDCGARHAKCGAIFHLFSCAKERKMWKPPSAFGSKNTKFRSEGLVKQMLFSEPKTLRDLKKFPLSIPPPYPIGDSYKNGVKFDKAATTETGAAVAGIIGCHLPDRHKQRMVTLTFLQNWTWKFSSLFCSGYSHKIWVWNCGVPKATNHIWHCQWRRPVGSEIKWGNFFLPGCLDPWSLRI